MRDRDHRHAVLVVDDYDDLRHGLIMALSLQGFDARGAASGSSALDTLARGYRPCLILLDLHMPEMDGWEVCSALRARRETAAIPIVLLSGDGALVDAQTDGVVGTLEKPCEATDLVATVAAYARCAR